MTRNGGLLGNAIGQGAYAGKLPAWHRLGNVYPDGFTFREKLNETGMGYNILTRPMGAIMPDNTVYATGNMVLMREPTPLDPAWKMLGVCSQHYGYFQNTEIADLMDDMATQTGWDQATMGAIGNGHNVFMTLDAGTHNVAGEDILLYASYVSNRDGRNADYLLMSPIRIVCVNTQHAAFGAAKSKITMQHSSTLRDEAAWRTETIISAKKSGKDVITALNRLASVKIDESRFETVVNAVLPAPKLPTSVLELKASGRESLEAKAHTAQVKYDRELVLVEAGKNAMRENFERFNDEYQDNAGNGWGAYQAVTEYVTHQFGTLGRGDVIRGKRPSETAQAVHDVLGNGMDMRSTAYATIMGFAGKGKR